MGHSRCQFVMSLYCTRNTQGASWYYKSTQQLYMHAYEYISIQWPTTHIQQIQMLKICKFIAKLVKLFCA